MGGGTADLVKQELKDFEGTFVMTSAAEDAKARFPADKPNEPTYFTGRLIEILNEGLEVEEEVCSFKQIYNEIEVTLLSLGLPKPQSSQINNASESPFFRNV